ncbi:MAG: adhesin [Methanobrevibacter millerae]|uniref:Adhesin n=1 Tax=Methanobrevibacter millerae TaxID=230361 RepID=A0A8T3VFK3_9EURY|nr:adhesin [Methanobrevibacter millerae]
MKNKIILFFLLIFVLVSLGAVSAADANDAVLADEGASDIYVNIGGNDSNAGTSAAPYATISKAIEESGNSSTIHLSEGIFTGENNSALTVNKGNLAYNGTITIVGAGIDKTIIDLNGTQFLWINSRNSIALTNLAIINGYSSYGGAVYSEGSLTVDNVKFENNFASSSGGAVYAYGIIDIQNSIFENNYVTSASSRGGTIYVSANSENYAVINNNKFKNSYAGRQGGTIYASYANITNNEIENSTATGTSALGGAIYSQLSNFKNNTMIDCTSGSGNGDKIYASSFTSGVLTIMDNSTFDVLSTTIELNAILTDDMGNAIHGPSISFYFNDTFIGYASSQNGIVTGTFTKLLDNGIYTVNAGNTNGKVITATANYKLDRTFNDLYVSPTLGNDTTGNGSKNNPYASIKKAITEGFNEGSFLNIYLLEGTYAGSDNTAISLTNLGYLNIIGENDNVIIDGNNTAMQAFNFGQNLNLELTNITFASFNGRWSNVIYNSQNYQNPTKAILKNITFENNTVQTLINLNSNNELYGCKVINNQLSSIGYNMYIIDNFTVINNKGNGLTISFVYGGGTISNSLFKDNEITGTGSIITSVNISMNNRFENNSIRAFSASSSNNLFRSINDTFINLTSSNGAVLEQSGNVEFINAKFINNTATNLGGVVYHRTGNLTFTDCTFENNKAQNGNDIYCAPNNNQYPILNAENTLTFVSVNSTYARSALSAVLNVSGLQVSGYPVKFYLNGTYMGTAQIVNNVANFTAVGIPDGIYEISGTVDYLNGTKIVKGILNLNAKPTDVYDTYVSQTGNDTTGNGSIDNPFATIKHAYDNAMNQNALSIVIHTNGTLKGEGNTLLNLNPDVNLTIVGMDKDTSIMDAENNKYVFEFEPYTDNVAVRVENLTIINGVTGAYISLSGGQIQHVGLIRSRGMYFEIENCLFTNVTGHALSAEKQYSSFIMNNCEFIDSTGAFFLYNGGAEYINITNSIFKNNTFKVVSNGRTSVMPGIIYISTTGNDIPYFPTVFMENLTFDGTYSDTVISNGGSLYLRGVNATIVNSRFNSINCSAIGLWGSYSSNSNLSIINSTFDNNYYDFNSGYSSQGDVRPIIELINTTIINGGGVIYPDPRYQNIWWNVVNSSFINMTRAMVFNGADLYTINSGKYCPVVNITNTLFLNNPYGINIAQGNISESSFYNSPLYLVSGLGSQAPPKIVYLNNNYWNSSTPNYNITTTSHTVYCDTWIVPGLTTNNVSGPVQNITLAFMSFDGENYDVYDVSNIPLFDENFTISVTEGTITPTSGILTKDGVNFTYTYDGLGNQTITAVLDNNITAELNVTFYKLETQLNLTINSDELHVGDNLTVNVVLADKDANLINGSVDVYLNSVLVDTIDVINGEGVLSIVMDKVPRVYEVFANYTGADKYQSSVNATTFTLSETEMNVSVENNNSKENVTFNVELNYPANGTVDVTIGNDTYTAPVEDGVAKLVIPPMDIGEYEALVSYNGIVNQTVPFNITRDTKTNIKAEDVEMYYLDGTKLNITLTDAYDEALANETILVSVGDKNYTAITNDEGIATVDLDVAAGNYTAVISYVGSETQDAANTTANIVVLTNTATVIVADDLVMYYKNGSRLYVTLTDALGNVLANESVIIELNGANYTRVTDANGTASIAINLDAKTYNATLYYKGSETQDAANKTVTIDVLSTINGKDITKVFRNGTQYYATFTDGQGNPLANGTMVRFNINGVMYDRKVNENGTARLNINLDQGTYILTAIHPDNGEMASNNITVLPKITENSDLVKYYRNDSQYVVRIIGDDGNPVGANETVTFNINGVMYERKTNESGHAKLNINLQPGDYIITAMYGGCNVANNITVKPILNATNVTMKYRDGTQFKASLVDGQGNPYAGQNVTFNINGVFYNRETDSQGIAKLNINLMAGEYIITSMYNNAAISNKITISA